MISWVVIPFHDEFVLVDLDLGLLYIFAVSSLSVYGIILAGWASNSRYAFLGALRAAAQMVSYEVSIGLILINIALCVGSLNFMILLSFSVIFGLSFPFFHYLLCFLCLA